MRLVLGSHTVVCTGEVANGDAIVYRVDGDHCLFAVIDGLGHGPNAQAASQAGVAAVEALTLPCPVRGAIEAMHAAMRSTRGAAAMVCNFHADGRLEGCGVGNVELRQSGARVPVALSPGILGRQVRKFRLFDATLSPGARLFVFTDGISRGFATDEFAGLDPTAASRAIIDAHGRDHDDSSILIADVEE